MKIGHKLWAEMEQEARVTKSLLAVVPFNKKDFRPDKKSMTLERLSVHVAEMNSWVKTALRFGRLDLATHTAEPVSITSTTSLLDYFDQTLSEAQADLMNVEDSVFSEHWTMRNGDHIYFTLSKEAVVRTW